MPRFTTLIVAALVLSSVRVLAAPRTFVSSGGTDQHGCTINQPCKTVAAAITAADAGGEVIVLDSGGYDNFFVNKSLTVSAAPGVYAGISVLSGFDGIGIGGSGVNVTVRGFTINGHGADNGAHVSALGSAVTIENCVVTGFVTAGVFFDGANTTLSIRNTTIRGNGDGILARPQTATNDTLIVSDSVIADNSVNGLEAHASVSGSSLVVHVERVTAVNNQPLGTGFFAVSDAGTSALVAVSNSVASANKFGLATFGAGSPKVTVSASTVAGNISEGLFNFGGVLLSSGDNRVHDNNGGGPQTGGAIGSLPPL
jgi:hypothetical protein